MHMLTDANFKLTEVVQFLVTTVLSVFGKEGFFVASIPQVLIACHTSTIISAKEIMFSVAFVCLSFCLSACKHCLKSYEPIVMKYDGGVWGGKRNVIKF